jgi:hypothetical protein
MATGTGLLNTLFRISLLQAAVGAAGGIAALLFYAAGLFFSAGGGILLDPSEIPVSLAGAIGGPCAGLITGFLQGMVFAPERNIPSHVIAGLFAGIWYYLAWTLGKKSSSPRVIRVSIWLIGITVYYYAVLLPAYLAIYSAQLQTPFAALYAFFAPRLVPELALTMAVTGFVLAVLPEKYARPMELPEDKPEQGGK